MKCLSETIQGDVEMQLQKANNLFTDLSEQLNETNIIIKVLSKICEIHDLMSELSDLKIHQKYSKIGHTLGSIKSLLDELSKSGAESKVFRALRAEYLNEYSEFLMILDNIWDKCVCWQTMMTSSWDNLDDHLKTQLTLSNRNETNVMTALQTMQSLGILHEKLVKFGKRFIQFIIKPIVIFTRLKPVQHRKGEIFLFTFIKEASKTSNIGIKTLLDRIMQSFQNLNIAFMNQNIPVANDGKEEKCLASTLGEIIWPSLSDIIIKDLLEKYIPNTSSHIEKYDDILSSVEKFEKTLVESDYLPDGTKTLSSFCRNLTTQYANKKCQDLLFTAREILKYDVTFHNTKLISVPDTYQPITPLHVRCGKASDYDDQKGVKPTAQTTNEEEATSENLFHFPVCRVSECIPEFLNLVYKTLSEATKTNKKGDVKLFYTARKMFEIYQVVVPTYYEEDLRDLPQISAVHYNNCMYISHHLLTLGHQFSTRLPEPLNCGAATFVDLISPIRGIGEKCFEDQLRRQSHVLLDIMESGGGFVDLSATLMEKSIKQVCYQLLKLNRVWKDILPSNIFTSSLGTLLNIVLNRFVDDILKLEDISSDDSHSFEYLMAIFEDKSPEALQLSAQEMASTVQTWTKFIELRAIIDSSLQNIENRWKDGKGPLAKEFSCNEIRSLIRALFQNTDRRACLLNKIRPLTT
ncbi:centromere/kinetochore protein zw10 homolog isoform X2 [Xenia sp. Carnegie-2017]|nr:centromere/kinetochore protein zw10 homolog isoform X2 [Xenia sp. Carnegie-2017]